jgi:methionine-rich copper-binding protein CopC
MQPSMMPAIRQVMGQCLGQARGQARRPVMRRFVTGSALILALCAYLHSAPVLAHAMLTKAEPPRRAQLVQPPAHVRLWFNEEVEKDYASLAVLDAAKASVTETKPEIDPKDPKAIVLPLPELSAGKYTVKFRVLSVDGHVVDSSYDFTVKSKAPAK